MVSRQSGLTSVDDAWSGDELLDRRREQLREHHWTMLLLSMAVIVCALLLRPQSSDRLAFIGWPDAPLPELCVSRSLFGIECPGCGLTRSFCALARGDLAGSLGFHRVGWLLALAVVLQMPYRIYELIRPGSGVWRRTWSCWFGYSLIAALVINWAADQFARL